MAAAFFVAALTGCGSAPAAQGDETVVFDDSNDPLEPMNRAIFSFNRFADGLLIKPLAIMYRDLVPPPVRTGMHNALDNIRTPVVLVNDLLQGDLERAGITIQRFAINTTLGLGGLMDMAAEFGIDGHREDFGQTLAVWGSGEGAYLMLPFFGPSNPRDASGLVVDTFLDPLVYFAPTEALATRTVLRGIDEREGVIDTLDEIERTSLDFYATLRSLYRQRRNDQIRNGQPAPIVPIPSISIDDFDGFGDEEDDKLSQIN